MKLCTQCKYSELLDRDTRRRFPTATSELYCIHPNAGKASLVDGSRSLATCKESRDNASACGIDGNWWEPISRPV